VWEDWISAAEKRMIVNRAGYFPANLKLVFVEAFSVLILFVWSDYWHCVTLTVCCRLCSFVVVVVFV